MNTVWAIARGTGLSALVLLSTATVIGTLVSRHGGNTPHPRPARRYVVQYLHRVFAGLGLAALGVHVLAILADSYAHVGWLGALLPFGSGYRPVAVALGTLAAYVFLGAAVLGLARGRIARSPRGARVWRRLHGLAYLGWAAAMAHGFLAGTDSAVRWVHSLYVACLVAVLGAIAARLFTVRPPVDGDRFAERLPPRPQEALR